MPSLHRINKKVKNTYSLLNLLKTQLWCYVFVLTRVKIFVPTSLFGKKLQSYQPENDLFRFSSLSTFFSILKWKKHKYFPFYFQKQYLTILMCSSTEEVKKSHDLPQLWVIWTREDLTSFIGVMLTKIPVSVKQDLSLFLSSYKKKNYENI